MAVKYARRLDLFKKQELGEILKLIEKSDIISFSGGLPASELFPVEEMKKVEDILITSGSQQALYYAGNIFLDEGDIVLCESTSYLGALNSFKNY